MDDAAVARSRRRRAIAAAAAISDPIAAAGVLLGGPAVVEGSVDAPAPGRPNEHRRPGCSPRCRARASWRAGSRTPRACVRRSRTSTRRSCETTSRARGPSRSWAAQSPAAPYVAERRRRFGAHAWVGRPFPGALGVAPVTSVVIVGDSASGAVTGIELDAWTEVVPDPAGTAGVAANLTAPDARAPNVILIAVPPDPGQPWTDGVAAVGRRRGAGACRLSNGRPRRDPQGPRVPCPPSTSPSSTRTTSVSGRS